MVEKLSHKHVIIICYVLCVAQDDAVEEKAAAILPADVISGLSSSNWKDRVAAVERFLQVQCSAYTLFTLSLTRPSPKLPSPVWPWPGEPSDLHWLGKSCIVGELSHLHLA